MLRARALLFGLAVLGASTASANITVKGTVRYWNGDVENVDGTTGAYVPARFLHVQVENDDWTVCDIDTWTDVNGKYSVTFKQEIYRPDFNRLEINIEVRASVWLDKVEKKRAVDVENTVSAYKGAVRLYPYNGQTRSLGVNDGSTVTINVYVQGPGSPTDFGAAGGGAYNLPIQSWDYNDDGRRTVAGIFMCQVCREEYQFLRDRAADKTELTRSTSIFYPEAKAAYRDTASIPRIHGISEGTGWIDMSYRKLFDDEKLPTGTWREWRELRYTVLHEFSHKLMHDVYWTMPKTHPWMSSVHDPTSCGSGEMGWREGWAQFLPASVLRIPTMTGMPVSAAKGVTARNIEHAWYPTPPGMPTPPCDDVPGFVTWRDSITGRRDWNEIEVAAVLWDIYDGTGWEYMPKAEQDKKPAGWPGELRWYERLHDPNLDRIWKMVKKQPEALNDEDEAAIHRDSFWTFWLKEYGNDKELVHGLKAILHNRDIRHTLRPQNAPEFVKLRALPGCTTVPFAELKVKEKDEEDRPFLYYNIAYSKGGGALKLMFTQDMPLEGRWSDDQLTGRIRLPDRSKWDRLVVKLHDSMTCTFQAAEGDYWQDDSQGGGPSMRLIDAAKNGTIAVGAGGSVWVWGCGGAGHRGPYPLRREDAGLRCRAVQVPDFYGAVAVAHGLDHYVALKGDGTVWTWGKSSNSSGALGIGDMKPLPKYAPNQVPGLTGIVAIDAAINVSMALKSDGTVWAWGHNASYNLGDGTRVRRKSPVQVQGLTKKITAISIRTGAPYAVAADEGGEVWAWGGRARVKPVKTHGLRNIVAVDVSTVPIALDKDGAVWEFGHRVNPYTTEMQDRYAPGKVPGLPKIIAIASGATHCLALAENGEVWSWGRDNRADQLGDAKRRKHEDCMKPALARTGCFCVAIAAGNAYSTAVGLDGHALTWGNKLGRADGKIEEGFATVWGHAFRTDIRRGQDPEFRPFILFLFR